MYRLHGFFTQNTMKTLYVLEELGVDYEFKFVDLAKGEQKTEEYLKMNPIGKAPVLQHNDDCLFESGAICRYLANVEGSLLYPEDKLQRAKVDQWLDFFSHHLGRWLTTLFFEQVIKTRSNLGNPNSEVVAEATKFAKQQMATVDKWLENNTYLIGDSLTIADLCAFAYMEQTSTVGLSIKEYPHLKKWFNGIESRQSVSNGRGKVNH